MGVGRTGLTYRMIRIELMVIVLTLKANTKAAPPGKGSGLCLKQVAKD